MLDQLISELSNRWHKEVKPILKEDGEYETEDEHLARIKAALDNAGDGIRQAVHRTQFLYLSIDDFRWDKN